MKNNNDISRQLSVSLALLLLICSSSHANSIEIDGAWVAAQVWKRDDGDFVSRQLSMELVDRNGKVRKRSATVLRWKDDSVKKTQIRFTAPRRVKGTAFLTYDYIGGEQPDEQWLYLPALKKSRRIPASDRGDSFMGTDFSYEDVKSELKFPLDDYDFELIDRSAQQYVIQGTPKTPTIADDLGYGRFIAVINPDIWLPTEITFWDVRLQPLKQVVVLKFEEVSGYWVATELQIEHSQNEHKTRFTYQQIDYLEHLDEGLFSVSSLGD